MAIGNVIRALSKGNADRIPYNDHLITRLMSDSLGGSAKTLMFVNVSPSLYNCPESENSLKYATEARNITNLAVPGQGQMQTTGNSPAVIKGSVKIATLEDQIFRLKELLRGSNKEEALGELEAEFEEEEGESP